MLITIEGPDKAGKTTQLQLLKDYSEKNKCDWVFTRNPGGTELGNKLRDIVLDSQEEISDKAELMIYLADRAHHVDKFIKPNLEQGKLVICDRFIDSTVAYQGYGRGIDTKMIQTMNKLACGDVIPDLTILLTVSDKVADERRQGEEKDRLESESKLFFVRVRNGYMAIAKQEPLRFKIIETDNLTPEEIHKQIIEQIQAKNEANFIGKH